MLIGCVSTLISMNRQPGEFFFDQNRMRSHLIKCFEDVNLSCQENVTWSQFSQTHRVYISVLYMSCPQLPAPIGLNAPPVRIGTTQILCKGV